MLMARWGVGEDMFEGKTCLLKVFLCEFYHKYQYGGVTWIIRGVSNSSFRVRFP